MRQIRKLSTKLLIALGVMVLSVIVWQVIVSKRVIGDMVKISQVQSIEQIHDMVKTGKLKTYHSISCHPFSKINSNGVHTYILKGNEYAIYVSAYYKRHIAVEINGDELFLNFLSNPPAYSYNTPVFIFMPAEPQQVVYLSSNMKGFSGIMRHRIYGFRGENTFLLCKKNGEINHSTDIITDMSHVNINQKDVDIRLQESIIENLEINSQSKVGTLSLQGTLYTTSGNYNYIKRMQINYPGQCDSLIIRLTDSRRNAKQLFLSKELSGRFENIDCSDNVMIVRE